MRALRWSLLFFAAIGPLSAQQTRRSALTQRFVAEDAPVIVLAHVKVINGTGQASLPDRTVILRDGMIDQLGPADKVSSPAGARVLDLTGYTLIPGIIGMHQHTYFAINGRITQMTVTGPRLYLAGGVTTIRTAGSFFPYNELNLKRAIDAGDTPGPRIFTSAPYLNGVGNPAYLGTVLKTPEDARRVVAYWAEEGATWLKFQGAVSRAIMAAGIEEAHHRGMKVTGHLCSVTFREAAALGIDALEHGFITNSEFVPDKKPDICPANNMLYQADVDVESPIVQASIQDLVEKHVALTSTLSVYELFMADRAPFQQRVLDAMSLDTREMYLASRKDLGAAGGYSVSTRLFAKMMQYERAFARAGGVLTAGVDPWGNGSLPGYGDQRNYELLCEAGFTAPEAIRIMTLNGATVLGIADRYGSIEAGKVADLVVIKGDPETRPADIENVTLVFKAGAGYDSAKLIASVKGLVGLQ